MILSKSKIFWDKFFSLVLKTLGISSIVFWGVGFIGLLFDYDPANIYAIIFSLLFALIGVALTLTGHKKGKLLKQLKEYTAFMNNGTFCSVADLATNVGVHDGFVRENLRKMMKRGYLKNARFDIENDAIVFGMRQESKVYTASKFGPDAEVSQNQELVTVVCTACGGINNIPSGTPSNCEYCNSPIHS